MDKSASNYTVSSGDSVVNASASSYYPKPSTPMDVRNHPSMSPNMRVQAAFQSMEDGDMDKPRQGMDDSGR